MEMVLAGKPQQGLNFIEHIYFMRFSLVFLGRGVTLSRENPSGLGKRKLFDTETQCRFRYD